MKQDTPTPTVNMHFTLSPEILSADSYVACRSALRIVREDALKTAAAADRALRELNQAAEVRGIRPRGRRPLEGLSTPPGRDA
jgi:hypothetical protein